MQTSPDTNSTVSGTSPLPVNTWSHVALTYDGSALRLFVNGQQVNETALTGSLYNNDSPLRIGGNEAWDEFFSGLIDEVRVYNRAQTAAEIQTDMNTPVGSTTPGPDPTPTPTPTPTPDPDPEPVPGLVAAYGMEEGTGTTVGDSSGQNNTGAATDTAWTTTGKHGKALSFNGTSSWVTVPHAESLRLTDTLTLSAWVRPAAAGGYRTVLMKENDSDGSYALYSSSEGSLPMGWVEIAAGPRAVQGDDPLPLNQWSHLALTYDGSMATLYVNGAQVDQYLFTGEIVDDGGVLRLGGNALWEDEFYSGLIDEVRVYNVVQTAAQIQADMNAPIGAAATGVMARRLPTNSAPEIQKLAVGDSRTVDGVTVTSDLTPQLTAWLSAGRNGEAKVEVEIADKPTKSVKADKVTTNKRLIWSGEVTAKPNDTQVSLQVPKGKLRDGKTVRWRARATTASVNGAWTTWHTATINTAGGGQPLPNGEQATQSTGAAADNLNLEHITTETCRDEGWESRPGFPPRPVLHDQYRPFTWCYTWTYGVTLYHTVIVDGVKTKIPMGFTQFTATTVILTRIGNYLAVAWDNPARHARDIDVWYKIEPEGVRVNDNAIMLNANIRTAGDPGPGVCAVDGPSSRKASRADWESNPYAHFKIKSSTAASTAPDMVGTCKIAPYIEVSGYLNGKLLKDEDVKNFHKEPEVMCDTSPRYRAHYGGCILARGNRFLTYYENSVKHGEVARHIKSAFANTSKVIPGDYVEYLVSGVAGRGAPLHRIWEEDDNDHYETNVTEKDKACKLLTRPAGYQCDEYPFASAYEGAGRNKAGTLTANVSYKYLSASHNGSAGTALRLFYQRYRLLEEDPFWILISPGAGPSS
ncbi:LamG-like jellyroll fold domain-containing protein [Nonomuraea cavernae]|uniref:LamG-like jellyroll fold domain-containing protein n=1 Tax=Nonomuraea cavernae TaxID=2045107 RepID=UPI003408F6DF